MELNTHESKLWVNNIDSIVFSGGGVLGISYLGVMNVIRWYFDDRQIPFSQLRHFSGASAGAFFSLLLCVGCDRDDLERHVIHDEYERLVTDIRVDKIMDQWGLNGKERIIDRVRGILAEHVSNADITFAELYKRAGRSLTVSVSCIENSTVEMHSHVTTPDYVVWKSVIASMTIPILFVPSVIEGKHYCDGGMLNNVPIPDTFDLKTSIILVLSKQALEKPVIRTIRDYVERIIYMPLDVIQNIQLGSIPDMYKSHIVRVETPAHINSYSFIMSKADRHELVASGIRSVLTWLAT